MSGQPVPPEQVILIIPRELAEQLLRDLSILAELAPKSLHRLGGVLRREGVRLP